ncbi:MAG: NAD(P)-dependent oxidoreductase [Elusimicrobiota bacterium]
MKEIIFFETTQNEKKILKTFKPQNCKLSFYPEKINEAPQQSLKKAEIISVFIYSQVTQEIIKKCPKLKLIATRSTGFDHIDIDFCQKKNITVTNVPFYGENTVAEHTFALILALSRKVHQGYLRTIRGDFSFEGLQGFDLKGKTIGIIGTGHIGLHAIRIAKGFGMNVIAYDIFRNDFLSETLGFQYVSFDELIKNADIISLHAPNRKETHHMINKDNIHKIKKGALLINTARGSLVETEALAIALDKGILAGAGLDVLEGEELIKEERQILSKEYPVNHLKTMLQNHILLNRENVVITPHIAFNSKEAFSRILETTMVNIDAYLKGKEENSVFKKKKI